jgi:hypothetical protein
MYRPNKNTIAMLVVVALLALAVYGMCDRRPVAPPAPVKAEVSGMELYEAKKEPQVVEGDDIDGDSEFAPADLSGTNIDLNLGCAMNSGVGLASSLLPREMASQEDFGQFAPDEILKGQNFLDPRQQIGFPETLGGALRNANQQIRADPPNPKRSYEWNNSTIVPDLMQRKMCA